MIAIILNSGLGKRMEELTDNKPKCLVEFNNRTILDRQLDLLKVRGIKDFIITTGPFADKIKEFVKRNYPEINVDYVHNERYDTTNYIYSLYCIDRQMVKEDILLLHGDLVFSERVAGKILARKNNSVLVNQDAGEQPEKDFMARINKGRVKKISVKLRGENCFPLMPFYKLDRSSYLEWDREITNFVENGKVDCYAEEALNKLLERNFNLRPVDFSLKECMEVDNKKDLQRAKKYFK